MRVIDEVLNFNYEFASRFNKGGLPMPPARRLAVLACMDARLDVAQVLGLRIGDAHVIRNAGGIVTDDALRSFFISHYLLGTREFMIINHTDCGMVTFKDRDLRERLERETGAAPPSPVAFHAFSSVQDNVREQMLTLKLHPWMPKDVPVRGFIYDVKTGRLSEVEGPQPTSAE